MVGLCAMEHYVLVHLVVGDFGQVGLLRHCWEDLVVDRIPAVSYCLGSKVNYFGLALIDCWGKAGWDGFVVQTLVPTEWVEQGQGLGLLALVVHSIFEWVVLPQMWDFALGTVVLAKPWPEPTTVVQVVHNRLLLRTGTSF